MTMAVIDTLSTVTLYERLGGSAGIRRIVDGMVEAHLENPAIRPRFVPYLDQPERVGKMQARYCRCRGTSNGLQAAFDGRDMEFEPRGLNIGEGPGIHGRDENSRAMTSLVA